MRSGRVNLWVMLRFKFLNGLSMTTSNSIEEKPFEHDVLERCFVELDGTTFIVHRVRHEYGRMLAGVGM